MKTKIFELAGGDLLVIPGDTHFEIVSTPRIAQAGDPERDGGELHFARARATALEDAIERLKK